MTIWTVMFGDDPFAAPSKNNCKSTDVKVFNTRETAYQFKQFCIEYGFYADVVFHPYTPTYRTLH